MDRQAGEGTGWGRSGLTSPSPSLPEAQHVRAWPKLQPIGPPLFLPTFNFCFQRIIARGNCKGPVLVRGAGSGDCSVRRRAHRSCTRPRTLTSVTHSRTSWRHLHAVPTWVPLAAGVLGGVSRGGRRRAPRRSRRPFPGRQTPRFLRFLRGPQGLLCELAAIHKCAQIKTGPRASYFSGR